MITRCLGRQGKPAQLECTVYRVYGVYGVYGVYEVV